MPNKPDTETGSTAAASGLLGGTPVVINVGLERFAADLAAQNVSVTHVDWTPPAGGDPVMADLLARLGA